MSSAETSTPEDSDASRKRKIGAVLLAVAAIVAILALFFMDDDGKKGGKTASNGQTQAGGPAAPTANPSHYALNKDEEHVQGIEAKMAPMAARFADDDDPTKTPCEKAFGGFKAFLEA